MGKSKFLYGGIVLAIIFVAIAIYYITPNHYHILASPPYEGHIKHAILFFVLAIVSVLVGLSNRSAGQKES